MQGLYTLWVETTMRRIDGAPAPVWEQFALMDHLSLAVFFCHMIELSWPGRRTQILNKDKKIIYRTQYPQYPEARIRTI